MKFIAIALIASTVLLSGCASESVDTANKTSCAGSAGSTDEPTTGTRIPHRSNCGANHS